jgi:hypothetical protein
LNLCFFLAQQSYINLISIAKECFKNLLIELKDCKTVKKSHTDRAQHLLDMHEHLDYSQSSFMNLFNYNNGHLGPHQDRCLVTVVYTQQLSPDHSSRRSPLHKNLWCLEPGQDETQVDSWTSIDKLVAVPDKQHSVCLHVGEEMSALYDYQLPAALHCVQANPTVPEKSMVEPDAGGAEQQQHQCLNNRFSAALILSAADISAIVDDIQRVD